CTAALCAGVALVATPVGASEAQTGTISNIFSTSNGALMFDTSGTRTAVPSCGSGNPTRYAIDASTTAGQAQASVLLTAYTLHKQIYVYGTGACTIWGDTETVNWISVAD